MPDLSGREVLARLQIKLRRAMPAVMFTTGRDAEEDVVAVLNAGVDDFIVKRRPRPVVYSHPCSAGAAGATKWP